MYAPAQVKTSKDFPIPERMKAWVLGNPGELSLVEKPVPGASIRERLTQFAESEGLTL